MSSQSTPIRRSQRIKEVQSSQPVIDDEEIEDSAYEDQDESYGETTPKKRKRTTKGPGKPANSSKKSKRNPEDVLAEMRENFEEHYIFQALNDSEASISELANDWLEQYKSNKDLAKKDLVNLILNVVGCYTTIEEHDVANNESASETVSEIQTFFKRQLNHEFYLVSKKPEYANLKRNLVDFANHLISISEENGLLYENIVISEDDEEVEEPEDSNLMEDLLIWLSSFSVSYIRSLRYVSTLLLLNIESSLCQSIVKVNTSLEKFKHQLEKEQEKRTKKQNKALEKRITQMESNVNQYTNQSLILDNFIQDILNTTFIHRFKDIDYQIRVEAMSSLGDWMDLYPELFFKVTYLKYLGWVLSDENQHVRLQVIKTLIKLLKKNIIVTGLRQFFERFKNRIIEIAFHDVDRNVKTNAINLLNEINKIGFLEDEEIGQITSLIFTSKDPKIIKLVSKFINTVESENTKATLDALTVNIKTSENSFPLDLKEVIKIHNLIEILTVASDAENQIDEQENQLVQSNKLKPSPFAIAGKELFALPAYSDHWEFLIRYFLLDIDSTDLVDDELSKAITLTAEQETVLFGVIHGALIHLKETNEELKKKNKEVDDSQLQKLITHLPLLLKKVHNEEQNLSTFIQILLLYPVEFFENFNQSNTYKTIFQQLIKQFKNNSVDGLQNEFKEIFKVLENTFGSTTVDEINSLFKDLVTELIIEFENYVKDPSFELSKTSIETLHEDFVLKLLLLSLKYDTSDVFKTFEYIRSKVFTIFPDFKIESISSETATSLIELYLTATSYKLNYLIHTQEELDIEKELKEIPDIIQEYQYLLNHVPASDFQTKVVFALTSLLTLLKNFFVDPNPALLNVNRFHDIDLASLAISEETTKVILNLFLTKEAYFANLVDIDLERDDDEDVNFNSIKVDTSDLDDQELTQREFEVDLDLSLYSAKLLDFGETGLLDRKVLNRIKLNKESLSELFESVVERYEQKKTTNGDSIVTPQPQQQPTQQQSKSKSASSNRKSIAKLPSTQEEEVEDEEDSVPEIAMDD
ncbi:Cohesin subunit SA-1 [Wickerhamomyces ciferrii]|uniref:Cohesin subunit SA-1 n=1 Tax=Wickerhamomyces ciferrii (strain ATCC 14091 / BCRC 22168 / CBS 111 / JCM 3599 / NBRC 0793 / NRRL Y-1031 F-60-10) TaxID=1206466 RepID=K0KK58_WICCF|nr:Cohesin subunit SA-1 [Wickerhamomyces ciferrii]CCH43301.1 Cohesin subunit SA-1 [Wickerhamomyces ciferrii]